MKHYHQRVAGILPRGLSPDEFDEIRTKAIYKALDSLPPSEAFIIRTWANNILNILRQANQDFSLADAIDLAGVVAAAYSDSCRRQNTDRLPSIAAELFLALDPRPIVFDDLNQDEVYRVANMLPTQIAQEYDINRIQAIEWYHRARRQTGLSGIKKNYRYDLGY